MTKALSVAQLTDVVNFAIAHNSLFSKRRKADYPLVKSIEPTIDLQHGTVTNLKIRGAKDEEMSNPTWPKVMAFLTNAEEAP